MTSAFSLQRRLAADVDAPRGARDAIRHGLGGALLPRAMEELLLAVSEMVTMVLRGAGDATVDLRVSWRRDVVRVEVGDGATEIHPGMGGEVLTVLAARWGLDPARPRVWAELARA